MFSRPMANSAANSPEEHEALKFFKRMIPSMICYAARKSNARKRRLSRPTRSKKRGRSGQTWQQRKKGDIKPESFTWWQLIKQPDVANVRSRNGKVIRHSVVTVFDIIPVNFA